MAKFLFVCTGNICRSPTADGMMRHIIQERGLFSLQADSAGIQGYHVGESPDPRTIEAAARRGYDLSTLTARKVKPLDYTEFDYLLAMDRSHERWLMANRPAHATAHIELFLENAEVSDPYYGGPEGFERVLDEVEQGIEYWLHRVGV